MDSFLTLIQSATSPDALEAQRIILRRIAMQGDVVASRVKPPNNISEIGGYINLLSTLKQPEMQQQLLAGILGVAGPNPPIGWLSEQTPLSIVSIRNDRPAGAAQAKIPLMVGVRSDFVQGVQTALAAIHAQGATLPLASMPVALPVSAPGQLPPADLLPYLGRTLDVVPAAALRDPANDPLVLARPRGSSQAFALFARVINTGSVAVTPADYDAVVCTATACTTIPLNQARLVPLANALADAGFYPVSPLPMPTSSTSLGWGRFINITGLVEGVTRLGDELSLLYSWSMITNSSLSSVLSWVWDGSKFAAMATA